MDNLDRVALIAHFGGVNGLGFEECLVLIRMLTVKQSKQFNRKTFAELQAMVTETKSLAATEYNGVEKW